MDAGTDHDSADATAHIDDRPYQEPTIIRRVKIEQALGVPYDRGLFVGGMTKLGSGITIDPLTLTLCVSGSGMIDGAANEIGQHLGKGHMTIPNNTERIAVWRYGYAITTDNVNVYRPETTTTWVKV